MRKNKTALKSAVPEIYGANGAAKFLGCSFRTVVRHADLGTLPCVRDDSGKRLFLMTDLQAFKDAKLIGKDRTFDRNAATSAPANKRGRRSMGTST